MAPARAVAPGFSPLDDELGLLPGRLTPHLLELLVRLGAWVPFAPAAELLTAFTAVACSAATARRQTEAAGAVLVAAETAAAPALAPPADPGPPTDEHRQISADGAMIALTSGEWAEVRTVAVGRVTQESDPTGQRHAHAREVSYFSRLTSAEEFTRLAVVELHHRGVRAAAQVGAVNDGALWVQRFVDYHCPGAVRILDPPHALEHIANCARAVWGPTSAAVATWVAEQAHELLTHGPAGVLEAIRTLAAAHPEAPISEDLAYLEARLGQMDYPAFRAAGWPVGSGMVESANKLVVEARLKGTGMRWARPHVNPLLGLRNAVCNDRWAAVWPRIAAGLRAQIHQAQRARHPAPPAALPPASATEVRARVNAEIVAEVEAILAQVSSELAAERLRRAPVDGKPAASHPWRRTPLTTRTPSGSPPTSSAKG